MLLDRTAQTPPPPPPDTPALGLSLQDHRLAHPIRKRAGVSGTGVVRGWYEGGTERHREVRVAHYGGGEVAMTLPLQSEC